MKLSVSPDMPIRALLRVRPMAVQVLQEIGTRFWDCGHFSVTELCIQEKSNPSHLLAQIEALEAPDPKSDWSTLPLYHLIDHLTLEHRIFIQNHLYEIEHILDIHSIPSYDAGHTFKSLSLEFASLSRQLVQHMEEEENFLFPKILRYEACAKDRNIQPDFHKGSIRVFVAVKSLQTDKRLRSMLLGLIARTRDPAFDEATSGAGAELNRLLVDFETQLQQHSQLETEVLFPLANQAEHRLYNLYIGG